MTDSTILETASTGSSALTTINSIYHDLENGLADIISTLITDEIEEDYQPLEENKDIYVLYHGGGCMDGLGAAFAAWKHFGDKAEYIPCSYGSPLPELELTSNSEVYFLDFSCTLDELRAIKINGGDFIKKAIIIDHHKSAYSRYCSEVIQAYLKATSGPVKKGFNSVISKWHHSMLTRCPDRLEMMEDRLGLDKSIFDMNESGAVLAWEYFHPDKEVPVVLQYVQDRDLWQFKLEHSKAFLEGMRLSGRIEDFEYWDELTRENPVAYVRCAATLESGKTVLGYIKSYIDSFLSHRNSYKLIDIDGYKVAIYNTTTLMSEIASVLYSNSDLDIDYTMSYSIGSTGQLTLSLRSKTGSKVDVSKIASGFVKNGGSGGGHKHAAGANFPFEEGVKFLRAVYTEPKNLPCYLR